jgi:hypothetical protein
VPIISGVFTIIGVLLGFFLLLTKEWFARWKKHAAFWQAINAELKYSGGLAANVFGEPIVEAPLYRLPRSAFETCYPQLLADGAISAAESTALITFFNEAETLNRGLDLAADTSDPDKRNLEYKRNCLKAKRLAPDGPLYKEAAAAIAAHIK